MSEILTHPIPAVLLLLGLLVIVHELGHFLAGVWSGVAVEIFSIGFGPVIFKVRRGVTDYCLSIVPLGGFVKFYGALPSEKVPDEVQGKEFFRASLKNRVWITAAGPLANFLLAIVAFAMLGFVGIQQPRAVIGEIMKDSAAEKAGLAFKDEVVGINGVKIKNWRDFERKISTSAEKTLSLEVLRKGERILLTMTPAAVVSKDMADRTVTIGRAGVSRGIVPSIVSILDANSQAHKAGLKSADKVVAVFDDSGTRFPMESWHDLSAHLADFVSSSNEKRAWKLSVERAPLKNQSASLGRVARQVDILVDPSQFTSLQKNPTLSARTEALNQLGIFDGQLMVAETEEPLSSKLKLGDILTELDGRSVRDPYELRELLLAKQTADTKFTIVRNFERKDIDGSLLAVEVQKASGKATMFSLPVSFWGQAIDPEPILEKYSNPILASWFGMTETYRYTVDLAVTLGGLLTGQVPVKALGGPMLIAKIAGDSAKAGWQAFVTSLAVISINLGLLNLFPIPVLDGGQLVLMGIEGLRRRPLSEIAIENYQKIGFVMVLGLVVLATYNDLSRFWTTMLESVRGLF